MGKTDCFFDGLEEWEKELSNKIDKQYPQEFRKFVQELALSLEARVKEKTPMSEHGGYLRNNWKCGKVQKRGNEYYVEVYNNTEYVAHVEYGHRKKGGKGFVKGAHMMEISLAEIHERLPNHLRNWMNDFLNENDIESLL